MIANPTAAAEALQFDRAVPMSDADSIGSGAGAVKCTACSAPLEREYFDVGGTAVCAACKDAYALQAAPLRAWWPTMRAILFGLAASVIGAVVYYGVIAVTDFEIGLVAIATGYMVGWAVRRGARGRGGRRLQIAAIALTYLSVGMAYAPLSLFNGDAAAAEVQADTAGVVAQAGAPRETGASMQQEASMVPEPLPQADTAVAGPTLADAATAIGFLGAFVLVLPLLVIFGTMPSGLISAAIIGFGMHQAWRMTGATPLAISGPYALRQADAPEGTHVLPIA